MVKYAKPTLDIDKSKFKVVVKLAIEGTKVLANSKRAQQSLARRVIAECMSKGRVESAKIKSENLIREDLMCEALDLVESACELLLGRFSFMQMKLECDEELLPTVSSLIYASTRVDVKELGPVIELLRKRFGDPFYLAAVNNTQKTVPERLLQKLSPQPPKPELVDQYVELIGSAYRVGAVDEACLVRDASPKTAAEPAKRPADLQSADTNAQKSTPAAESTKPAANDFDQLMSRLDALKRK